MNKRTEKEADNLEKSDTFDKQSSSPRRMKQQTF